jgi:hypothetical protein
MARLNRLQGGDTNRTQNSAQDGLDALERSSLGPASQNGASQASNGVQTPRRTIKEDKPTLIPHKLGRPYRGWNVALKNEGVSFYCPSGQKYDKSKFICVQFPSGGPTEAEAEFWVF